MTRAKKPTPRSSVTASGEHSVAIGGDAQGNVIFTGDILPQLTAPVPRGLERLLAQKTFNLPSLPEHYLPREADLEPLRHRRRAGDGRHRQIGASRRPGP